MSSNLAQYSPNPILSLQNEPHVKPGQDSRIEFGMMKVLVTATQLSQKHQPASFLPPQSVPDPPPLHPLGHRPCAEQSPLWIWKLCGGGGLHCGAGHEEGCHLGAGLGGQEEHHHQVLWQVGEELTGLIGHQS